MNDIRGELPSYIIDKQKTKIKDFLSPEKVAVDDTIATAKRDFQDLIGKEFLEDELVGFIKDKVRQRRIGNAYVTFIAQEHEEFKGTVNPVIKAFLQHSRTKAFVPEYFLPELVANAKNMPLNRINIPFFRSPKEFIEGQASERGDSFMAMADICRVAGKPILTVDVTNNVTYEVYHTILPAAPLYQV